MTQLIVKPLDPTARGSFRERSKFFELIGQLEQAQGTQNGFAVASAFRNLEALIVPRLKTDDGSPVGPILDEMSAQDFDLLLASIGGAATNTVGEANAVP